MGLTLHYKLRAPAVTGEESARALVAKMRAAALAAQEAGWIEAVGAISSSAVQLAWLSEWVMVPVPDEPHTTRGIEVPAQEGFVFDVTLGVDCEPLRLGLCDYTVERRDPQTHRLERVGTAGWRLIRLCAGIFLLHTLRSVGAFNFRTPEPIARQWSRNFDHGCTATCFSQG